MTTLNMNQLADAFAGAQETFNNALDTTDFSSTMSSIDARVEVAELSIGSIGKDFTEIPGEHLVSYMGSVILLMNRDLQALSPAIMMPASSNRTAVTMLDQPYDPKVGFTPGQHFGLSVKAQTQTSGFGDHTSKGGFEAGHFSSVLIGARNTTIGDAIARSGDTATHTILTAGVPEVMSHNELMPMHYRTKIVPTEKLSSMKASWHGGLVLEHGIARGDYPNAVQLMMGSAVHVLGPQGLDIARALVDRAVQGAR